MILLTADRLFRISSISRPFKLCLASKNTWKLDPPQPYDLQMDFSSPFVIPDYEGYRSAKDVLLNLTESERSRLDLLRLQLELKKSEPALASFLPDCDKIVDKQWLELLACPNHRLLNRALLRIYRLQQNSQKDPLIFTEMMPSAVPLWSVEDTKHFYRARQALEFPFCDTMIIDLAFGSFMSAEMVSSFSQEIRHVIRINRESRQPFHLHMCGPGLNRSAMLASLFKIFFPGGFFNKESREKGMLCLMNEQLPYDFTDGCFTSFQPRLDSLVYIVPGSAKRLKAYDPNKTYILPGYPHRLNRLPQLRHATLKRAKSLNLQYFSPPVELLKPSLGELVKSMLSLKNNPFFIES